MMAFRYYETSTIIAWIVAFLAIFVVYLFFAWLLFSWLSSTLQWFNKMTYAILSNHTTKCILHCLNLTAS